MQCKLLIVLIINRSKKNCNFTMKILIGIAESYFRNKTRGLEHPAKLHKWNFDGHYNDLLQSFYLKML